MLAAEGRKREKIEDIKITQSRTQRVRGRSRSDGVNSDNGDSGLELYGSVPPGRGDGPLVDLQHAKMRPGLGEDKVPALPEACLGLFVEPSLEDGARLLCICGQGRRTEVLAELGGDNEGQVPPRCPPRLEVTALGLRSPGLHQSPRRLQLGLRGQGAALGRRLRPRLPTGSRDESAARRLGRLGWSTELRNRRQEGVTVPLPQASRLREGDGRVGLVGRIK